MTIYCNEKVPTLFEVLSDCSVEDPRKIYNDVTNLAYSLIYVSWSDSILGHNLAYGKNDKIQENHYRRGRSRGEKGQEEKVIELV